MVVTGDPTQVDLPRGQGSGLDEAVDILSGVEGVNVIRFTDKDVVRSELVKRIVAAYEQRTALASSAEHDLSRPLPPRR